MKISVFQSGKGDCLLLTGKNGETILVDGGMRTVYRKHVAPALARQCQSLDLVCVSHIDHDHIAGILELMDNQVAWRVHDFHLESGNRRHPRPSADRPPLLQHVWHNAFHKQIDQNTGPISETLAATASILSGTRNANGQRQSLRNHELTHSIRQGIQLSHRLGTGQLGICLNQHFDGKLVMVPQKRKNIRLGDVSIFVIGPFEEDLKKLRTEWNEWLSTNQEALEKLAQEARAEAARLKDNEIEQIILPVSLVADQLGRREHVSPPNLASIMLLVEEAGHTVLLTGDGHADDILKGLDSQKKLPATGLHVDVLKVPHHGSEHNLHEDFCSTVSADHYIFCADGTHENPDLGVLELIVRCRMNGSRPSPFTFWFSSSFSNLEGARRHHMEQVGRLVEKLRNASKGLLKAHFLKSASSLEIPIGEQK